MKQTEIRKKVISLRKNLTHNEILLNSQIICNSLLSLPLINANHKFMVYKSFKGEVDTSEIINRLILLNKTLLYPVIIDDYMISAKPIVVVNTFPSLSFADSTISCKRFSLTATKLIMIFLLI